MGTDDPFHPRRNCSHRYHRLRRRCGSGDELNSVCASGRYRVAQRGADIVAKPRTDGAIRHRERLAGRGTLHHHGLRPTFTFTVGDGWTALFPDDSDEMALEGPDRAFFAVTRPGKVVDPESGTAVATPDDLTTWLATHPSLTPSSPEPVLVSGIASQSIEVTPAEGKDVRVFAYPSGDMHFASGLRIRFYVLPLDGPDMVIVVGAPEAAFSSSADLAQQIVDSIEITES